MTRVLPIFTRSTAVGLVLAAVTLFAAQPSRAEAAPPARAEAGAPRLFTTLSPDADLTRFADPTRSGTDDCYEDTFCIESTRRGDSVDVFVRNLRPWEFTMRLDMRIENAVPDVELPIVRSFGPRARTRVAVLVIQDPSRGWSFSFDMKWMLGSTTSRHDPGVSYRLPWRRGHEYLVGQGPNGATTHQGIDAVDWDMPEGTEVLAARDGVVIDLEEEFSRGGLDPELKSRANFVKIRHDDGTIANYVHLLRNGVRVHVGDHVHAGQSIAYSGNTGYTSGPHLHFEVYTVTSSLERRTYPVRFTAYGSPGVEVSEGKYYGH
jgi:hypothetical protein